MALTFLWTNSHLADISADLAAIKASHVDILFSYLMTPATPDADMQAYLDALNTAGLKAMLTVRELGKNVVKDRPDKVLSSGDSANLIPTMTSATAPSGVVTSSGDLNSTYAAWKALDHVNPAGAGWVAPAGTTGWVQYQFPAAHIVFRYGVTSRNEASPYIHAPKSWTFKGSNNGTTWVTLDTRTNVTDWASSGNVRKTFDFVNGVAYTYYRIDITASNDTDYVGVGELEMMEATGELATLTAYINKWKGHPAVWGWYADDEGTAAQYPVSTRQQVYDAIKAAHPAGQVFEVHYNLDAGHYSPAVHDVFATDAYVFFDTEAGGCVSSATGLVTSPAAATLALSGYKSTLDAWKVALDAAGETNYLVCMQAFGQGPEGLSHSFAMPPPSGLWRMWGKVREAAWDTYGVGFFLWKSDDAFTLPTESLIGVGESPFAGQRAELAAIAAIPATYDPEAFGAFDTAPPAPPADTTPRLPAYSVLIGAAGTEPSNDITELVDLDTLHRSLSERGEASATIDIPVASENEVPVNGLVRDAAVEIVVNGQREWLGHVVAVHKPKPQDLSYVLDCAGGWDTLHHCAPYCKGFVETRYDAVTEYSPSMLALWGRTPFTAIDVSTDGEVLFTLPKGTKLKAGQCKFLYLWVLGGLDAGFSIKRITCDVDTSGIGALTWQLLAMGPNPLTNLDFFVVGSGITYPYSGSLDTGAIPGATPLTALQFRFIAAADVGEQTSDQTFQIRNLRIYIDRTTAPRVDEIVAAIDAEVRPGAPAASIEAIGAPLTAFMCDPFMTPADGIAVALTKAAVPPLCGVIQNQLVIKNRPTAPPDATRLWTVSEQITPGLEWGVEVDEEQSVDYVGVAYNVIGDALLPDGTPCIAYYPSTPPSVATRTGLIDGGDLTAAEAAAAAAQAYAYLHALASGPVTIPYVVQDANGNERPADVIRQWDWVQNVGLLDAELAGPFLVSEVEHQGHIATLTIGAAEAYAYNGPERMPVKGRYVGAYRTRKRTTQRVSFETYWHWKYRAYYKKHKKYPNMPKKHAKRGTIHGWKWIEHEGRYT